MNARLIVGRMLRFGILCGFLIGTTGGISGADDSPQAASPQSKHTEKDAESKKETSKSAQEMVRRGVNWLVAAQHPDGGWGGGSHAQQEIRDPAAVPSDPATTAFTASALLRAGNTPVAGEHRDAVIKAMNYLVNVVEQADPKGNRITKLENTQLQTKLGPMIDTAMTAQFLTRVLEVLPRGDSSYKRVDAALSECVRRMEQTQATDGSWNNGGGWAPVLQSAWSCNSLELAQALGRKVDETKLEKARDYQKKNVDAVTGGALSTSSAGVELYAFAGGLRGNAVDASQAQQIINQAKADGTLDKDAKLSEANLQAAGQSAAKSKVLSDAAIQNDAQLRRLNDETLLAGFGNNGGEEFLSHLMTSESLVIAGGEAWDKWNQKMKERLGKIQNPDGSWNGHHCITSPCFCTAAALQVVTTERDVELLKRIAAVKKK